MVSVACPRPGGDAGSVPLPPPVCIVLIGLFLALAPAAAQDTPYFDDVTATHVPTDTTAHLLDIDLGDVDGDGDLDAVATHEYGANRLYVNDGTGRFTDVTGTVMPAETRGRAWDVETGDVNGDGRPDVFIGGWDTQVRLLLGRGGPSD